MTGIVTSDACREPGKDNSSGLVCCRHYAAPDCNTAAIAFTATPALAAIVAVAVAMAMAMAASFHLP